MAPRGTPKAFTDRLNAELTSILALPEVKTAFETQGMVPAYSTPEQFRALMTKQCDKPRRSGRGPARSGGAAAVFLSAWKRNDVHVHRQ